MSSTRARSPIDQPYFAAYIKVRRPAAHVTDRLELVQDEWGYLL